MGKAADLVDELKGDPVLALAGLRQFLHQPRHAQTPRLLLMASVGGLAGLHLENADAPGSAVSFELADGDGHVHRYRCDPVSFALLALILVLGQSAFINFTGATPFLKVFGRSDKKAGIIFARVLLGAEADEQVSYRNKDALDLTQRNLVLSGGNATRGTPEWYERALAFVSGLPDSLFRGTPDEKFAEAKALLHRAMERLEEEREEASSR